MATTKKRKVDAECRSFQKKWTNDYFFVEVESKPVCLVCGVALAVMKKSNLERHYSTKHAQLNELVGEMRQDEINTLQRTVESQAVLTRPQSDGDNFIPTNYEVNEQIAKRLRPEVEEEFMKECISAAGESLAPDTLQLLQSLSRSAVSATVSDVTLGVS